MQKNDIRYGLRDVLDLYVYDENDNFIANLGTLKSAKIVNDKLLCRDALYNLNLLKFVYGESNTNNFNDDLERLTEKTANRFSKLSFKDEYFSEYDKKVKLIGKTTFRNEFTGKDHNVIMYAKNAVIRKCSNFNFDCSDDPAENIIEFELLPDEEKEKYVLLFQD